MSSHISWINQAWKKGRRVCKLTFFSALSQFLSPQRNLLWSEQEATSRDHKVLSSMTNLEQEFLIEI